MSPRRGWLGIRFDVWLVVWVWAPCAGCGDVAISVGCENEVEEDEVVDLSLLSMVGDCWQCVCVCAASQSVGCGCLLPCCVLSLRVCPCCASLSLSLLFCLSLPRSVCRSAD
ncbi:mucin-like glycoprotein [Trypanosoma cruzi]|nr:mucin-like glycoprotein [Trypanosoma cruzi]